MKIAIIGSRTFDDFYLLEKTLNDYKKLHDIEYELIISGGAIGADSLGKEYADRYGIETIIFLPDWNKYKKAAGFVRNKDIINNAEVIFAFWDGKSKGTAHSMNLARDQQKELIVVKF